MKRAADYTTIFSDDEIVVLNKRSGLCVAADRYDEDVPRLDLLAQNEFGRLLAVHRIDKDTSGLVVYTRSEQAQKNLSAQFAAHTVVKTYFCLVNGRPLWNEIKVTLPLMPDGDARHRTVVNRSHGKPSETDFVLAGACGPYSWIKAMPRTGRTHQIRAHLSANGLTIVCDPLYSGNQKPVRLSEIKRRYNGDPETERPLLERLALHAYKIKFVHPVKNTEVEFTAPFQKDMEVTRRQFAKLFGVDPLEEK